MIRKKKAQVTLFIIIALVLVAGIALYFLLRERGGIDFFRPSITEPQQYVEKCMKDTAAEAINIMLPQAGFISPENYKLYKDNKVGYLCYTSQYYYTCINQEPMYIEHLEEEIHNYIKGKIQDCFYVLEQEYKDKNYQVSSGDLDLKVKLKPKQVEINAEKKLDLRKGEESRIYEEFEAKFNSPLYDLAVIAQEIASQESKFCNFEYVGFSLIYPQFAIEKDQVGSEETVSDIYIVRDKVTGKELWIAIRSCAMPGGL